MHDSPYRHGVILAAACIGWAWASAVLCRRSLRHGAFVGHAIEPELASQGPARQYEYLGLGGARVEGWS
ncbi:MAG: hypothetical protein ACK559_32675 [bacterium]